MKKKLFLNLLIAFIGIATLHAIPARPIKHQLMQPDGTILTVYLRGDEFMHYYETIDGLLLEQNPDGFYCYATLFTQQTIMASTFVAHDPDFRSSEENIYIKGIKQKDLRSVLGKRMSLAKANKRNSVAPGEVKAEFPTTGVVRGLVILVQYQDIKFSEAATVEAYDRVMNEKNYSGTLSTGSVYDYFLSQSDGKLELIFDVVGPVTLSQNRVYYGGLEPLGYERVDDMMIEAVKLAREANPTLDFKQYDKNEDGVVDFVYAIYAGYGEAQGGPAECVWPQSNTLEYKDWTLYDGMYLGRYSCSCELNGNKGNELDGIGTFCHEFSHILGLPDIYDPLYSGCAGLDSWDVMDIGSYNNESKTPAGYTAMDKYTLGWLTPEILEAPASVSLEALATFNKAYFLVNDAQPNEYFTLENRQNVGWDAALPGHGLLICQIEYDRTVWKTNRVNTQGVEHVRLVVADAQKKAGTGSDFRDPFPGASNNTAFTDNTTPAMRWNNKEKVGKPITNIREENGVIYFDFIKDGNGIEQFELDKSVEVYGENRSIVIPNKVRNQIMVYSITGHLIYAGNDSDCRICVEKGCYIVRIGDKVVKVNVR